MPSAPLGQSVRIVSDCVAALPAERVAALRIAILPVYLTLEGRSHLDDGTLDLAWFYDQLERASATPTTASPSPQDILELYTTVAAEGAREIVALFTAASMSSIYDHALLAARMFGAARVHVIDTRQVSMGEGLLVLTAAEMARQGASAVQIVQRMRDMIGRAWVLGLIDAPDYLRRSGRVSWFSASMAGLLRIKPLITFRDGQAVLLERVRTMHHALRSLSEHVAALGEIERIAIVHAGADARWTQELMALMRPLFPDQSIPIMDCGAIFATHVGPRAVGVALITADL